jgi:MscS family membrane protein
MNIEQWQDFWALVVQVWQSAFLGVSVGRVLLALFIFFFFLVIRHLFSRIVMGAFKRLVRRTKNEVDDKVIEALGDPLELVPVIMGIFFGAQALGLTAPYEAVAVQISQSLIAIAIFWAIYNISVPVSALLYKLDHVFTTAMVDWAVRGTRVLVVFFGGVAVLEIWGIQVAPILAGLGLFGVAVALGAQDLFKNLIAGFLILIERRFKNGDWVKVEGIVEGTVERIGFRSTRIRRFDKAPVQVPNTQLSDNAVTNFSEMTYRRIYWVIGVEYRTSVAQLKQIRDAMEAYIKDNEDFAQPPEVPMFVRIDSFNSSSIDIMLYCFTRTTVWGEWLAIKEELAYRIKDIVAEAGTAFAFPSQSIYVETLPEEAPEVFVPPGVNDLD